VSGRRCLASRTSKLSTSTWSCASSLSSPPCSSTPPSTTAIGVPRPGARPSVDHRQYVFSRLSRSRISVSNDHILTGGPLRYFTNLHGNFDMLLKQIAQNEKVEISSKSENNAATDFVLDFLYRPNQVKSKKYLNQTRKIHRKTPLVWQLQYVLGDKKNSTNKCLTRPEQPSCLI